MSENDTDTQPTNLRQPVYPDGSPIVYDNNKAHIEGLLHEFGLWFIRTNAFVQLAKYCGVLVKNQLAVDKANAAYFISHSP